MRLPERLPGWVAAPIAAGAFLVLRWLERRRPLRKTVEPKVEREIRNLAVAGVGSVAVVLLETPLANALTSLTERRRWGLLPRLGMPRGAETAMAVLLFDYTMYLWHVLMHRVPMFWRFHLAHHTDLDLDASTALRFHFGELLWTVPLRAVQITAIGVTPLAFSLWQTLFTVSILFHHSGVRLPIGVERLLAWFVVTPRMHGIHHSIVRGETESNYASGLTIWDRLHGTLHLNVPQQEVTIGVPAFREPGQVTLGKTLRLPFEPLENVWLLPGGGEPVRAESGVPETHLLA